MPSVITPCGGGSGGSSVQAFCTYETFLANAPTFPHPQDLPFGGTAANVFNTNDATSFDYSGGRVRILKQGGYLACGNLHISGFQVDPGGPNTVAEIYDIYGVDDDGNRVDIVGPLDTPVGAWVTQALLPGGGGVTPTLQYMAFFNLRDDYTVSGTRPVVWPCTMHMRLDWSVNNQHNIEYSLVIMRFG
jgi:hypothetical protein